jgi:hypothetical protein
LPLGGPDAALSLEAAHKVGQRTPLLRGCPTDAFMDS